MRAIGWPMVLVVLLGVGVPVEATAEDAPPFADVQAAWTTFWARIAADDIPAALSQLHTSVRVRFPGQRDLAEWRDVALQMPFCRLQERPESVSAYGAVYRLHCRHGTETAESLVIVRRDRDGAWRLLMP